ncbi:MAG: polyhydroxyalkanoic acid system family protein, partial [Chloroflexi bacterium]|nr:polyhydroxyalkanoic acid system family protein [Chloroflexota bacterium]
MEVRRYHNMTMDAAMQLADQILPRFIEQAGDNVSNVERQWDGNVLRFAFRTRGMNIKGTFQVTDDEIIIESKLPFIARPFEGRVRSAIEEQLDIYLPNEPAQQNDSIRDIPDEGTSLAGDEESSTTKEEKPNSNDSSDSRSRRIFNRVRSATGAARDAAENVAQESAERATGYARRGGQQIQDGLETIQRRVGEDYALILAENPVVKDTMNRADLLDGNDTAGRALDEALKAAHALPGPGWRQRLAGEAPQGTAESFFAHVRRQVYARAPESPYSLETETEPPIEGLADATARLDTALARLERPLGALIGELGSLLDDGADELDTPTRNSIEALRRGLERRGILALKDWRAMLRDLHEETPPEFVDWFGVERIGGRDVDLGLHRHWVDPVRPFAGAVAETAHGILITSATLTDQTGDEAADWAAADLRTGARHPAGPVERLA